MSARTARAEPDTPVPDVQLPPPTLVGRLTHAFVIAYVVVQVFLPLRGILWTKHDTRGNFSWNMYSQLYSCSVRYEAVGLNGIRRRVRFREDFIRESKVTHTYHREQLPKLHAWLCEEHLRDSEMLYGQMRCSINNGDRVRLVRENIDLCEAEDWGVLPRSSAPPRRRR